MSVTLSCPDERTERHQPRPTCSLKLGHSTMVMFIFSGVNISQDVLYQKLQNRLISLPRSYLQNEKWNFSRHVIEGLRLFKQTTVFRQNATKCFHGCRRFWTLLSSLDESADKFSPADIFMTAILR